MIGELQQDENSGLQLQECYAYYRRCQVIRRNGEQCKAPAEKGAHICHSHALQQEMARRRKEARRALLTEVARQMSRATGRECEPAEVFCSFEGIQRAISEAARALIEGRIDCKTAGRLAVDLQMAAKLLRMVSFNREGRRERQLPQICAEQRRFGEREKAGLNAEALRRGEKQQLLQIVAGESRSESNESPKENNTRPRVSEGWEANHRGHGEARRRGERRCSAVAGQARRRFERLKTGTSSLTSRLAGYRWNQEGLRAQRASPG